ncbi:MAG: oxidoreductase [Gammaproteobacteria bacterium]|nr:oxidoreductase [Gammaproteobacteria bacterium]
MSKFKAFRIHERDKKIVAGFEMMGGEQLTPGDVLIRVRYSSINYKDALAATGAARILRRYPLNGGIDLSGEIASSADTRYARGQAVLVTGCGLSETVDGGFAEYARVAGNSVIRLPDGIDLFQAMGLGTAGFTAALAIHRMEHNGQTPARGPVVVTGASGGVGSIAVDLLAGRGYEVVAVSGKPEADDFLKALGATSILRRQEIDLDRQPMEAVRWAGAIDNVGGELLTWLTRTMDFWGNIASVGLAGSPKLETTVLPFILRGVNLLGINSSATPRDLRLDIWRRLASDLRPRHFDKLVTRIIGFDELPAAFDDYMKGRVLGRTVVKIA